MTSVRLNKHPNYDAFLFDTVGDTRQNHWTMKYRPQCPAKKMIEVICIVKLNKYPRCDTCLFDRARDIRQNHWTVK